MGRGLDGLISRFNGKLCSFEGPLGLAQFPVAIAWGKHLFPFRTEQLSPTAPMVLGSQGPGRVGRRRFILEWTSRPQGGSSSFWAPLRSFRARSPARSRPQGPALGPPR
jgi:hypothetical protein